MEPPPLLSVKPPRTEAEVRDAGERLNALLKESMNWTEEDDLKAKKLQLNNRTVKLLLGLKAFPSYLTTNKLRKRVARWLTARKTRKEYRDEHALLNLQHLRTDISPKKKEGRSDAPLTGASNGHQASSIAHDAPMQVDEARDSHEMDVDVRESARGVGFSGMGGDQSNSAEGSGGTTGGEVTIVGGRLSDNTDAAEGGEMVDGVKALIGEGEVNLTIDIETSMGEGDGRVSVGGAPKAVPGQGEDNVTTDDDAMRVEQGVGKDTRVAAPLEDDETIAECEPEVFEMDVSDSMNAKVREGSAIGRNFQAHDPVKVHSKQGNEQTKRAAQGRRRNKRDDEWRWDALAEYEVVKVQGEEKTVILEYKVPVGDKAILEGGVESDGEGAETAALENGVRGEQKDRKRRNSSSGGSDNAAPKKRAKHDAGNPAMDRVTMKLLPSLQPPAETLGYARFQVQCGMCALKGIECILQTSLEKGGAWKGPIQQCVECKEKKKGCNKAKRKKNDTEMEVKQEERESTAVAMGPEEVLGELNGANIEEDSLNPKEDPPVEDNVKTRVSLAREHSVSGQAPSSTTGKSKPPSNDTDSSATPGPSACGHRPDMEIPATTDHQSTPSTGKMGCVAKQGSSATGTRIDDKAFSIIDHQKHGAPSDEMGSRNTPEPSTTDARLDDQEPSTAGHQKTAINDAGAGVGGAQSVTKGPALRMFVEPANVAEIQDIPAEVHSLREETVDMESRLRSLEGAFRALQREYEDAALDERLEHLEARQDALDDTCDTFDKGFEERLDEFEKRLRNVKELEQRVKLETQNTFRKQRSEDEKSSRMIESRLKKLEDGGKKARALEMQKQESGGQAANLASRVEALERANTDQATRLKEVEKGSSDSAARLEQIDHEEVTSLKVLDGSGSERDIEARLERLETDVRDRTERWEARVRKLEVKLETATRGGERNGNEVECSAAKIACKAMEQSIGARLQEMEAALKAVQEKANDLSRKLEAGAAKPEHHLEHDGAPSAGPEEVLGKAVSRCLRDIEQVVSSAIQKEVLVLRATSDAINDRANLWKRLEDTEEEIRRLRERAGDGVGGAGQAWADSLESSVKQELQSLRHCFEDQIQAIGNMLQWQSSRPAHASQPTLPQQHPVISSSTVPADHGTWPTTVDDGLGAAYSENMPVQDDGFNMAGYKVDGFDSEALYTLDGYSTGPTNNFNVGFVNGTTGFRSQRCNHSDREELESHASIVLHSGSSTAGKSTTTSELSKPDSAVSHSFSARNASIGPVGGPMGCYTGPTDLQPVPQPSTNLSPCSSTAIETSTMPDSLGPSVSPPIMRDDTADETHAFTSRDNTDAANPGGDMAAPWDSNQQVNGSADSSGDTATPAADYAGEMSISACLRSRPHGAQPSLPEALSLSSSTPTSLAMHLPLTPHSSNPSSYVYTEPSLSVDRGRAASRVPSHRGTVGHWSDNENSVSSSCADPATFSPVSSACTNTHDRGDAPYMPRSLGPTA